MTNLTGLASTDPLYGERLSRRSVTNACLAAAVVLATSNAAVAAADSHAGHDHGGGAKYQNVIDAALACVNRGEVCINHCITLLGSGDTSLKDCIRTVSAMLPMCAALARFAALEAGRLKELAKLCIDVCADCEAECKKHAEHHAACKACAESCAACIKECKALIAA